MDQQVNGRLLFAVPKKGRLQQAALDLLSGSDIQFRREHRLDIALVKNHEIALVFLPAADIPTFVGEGRVALGITGRDQVAEYETNSPPTPDSGVEEVLDLGFGKCSLKVQVPVNGPYKEPKDLIGKKIVTSFMGLTERYFAELEGMEIPNGSSHEDVQLRKKLKTKLRYVGGSVEATCTLGVADGIIDLVESGETMRAAGLEAIGTVLDSTAVLIKSKHLQQTGTQVERDLIEMIAKRIRGVIAAQRYVLCQYNVPRTLLEQAKAITPGKRAPTVTGLEDKDWAAVSSMVESKEIATVMDQLTDLGATDVLVLEIKNSRTD